MKRLLIILLMLLLVGCLPTPDRALTENRSDRQNGQVHAVPISNAVLIPMDEQMLASFDSAVQDGPLAPTF